MDDMNKLVIDEQDESGEDRVSSEQRPKKADGARDPWVTEMAYSSDEEVEVADEREGDQE